jgi:hypothetical protein
VPLPIILDPPSGLAVNNAVVQFGYAEYGGNCTTRAEACLATGATIPSGNAPFFYASEAPAGLACASGCTVMVPGISQRVMLYKVIYRNAANLPLGTSATQVLVVP